MSFILTRDCSRRSLAGRQFIVHIDKTWGDPQVGEVDRVLLQALRSAGWEDASGELYYIAFLWRDGKAPVVDLWRFTHSPSNSSSGPLADVKIIRDGQVVRNIGSASGDTLLILGMEEDRRRRARSIEAFLDGQLRLPPKMISKG